MGLSGYTRQPLYIIFSSSLLSLLQHLHPIYFSKEHVRIKFLHFKAVTVPHIF